MHIKYMYVLGQCDILSKINDARRLAPTLLECQNIIKFFPFKIKISWFQVHFHLPFHFVQIDNLVVKYIGKLSKECSLLIHPSSVVYHFFKRGHFFLYRFLNYITVSFGILPYLVKFYHFMLEQYVSVGNICYTYFTFSYDSERLYWQAIENSSLVKNKQKKSILHDAVLLTRHKSGTNICKTLYL